jgi:2-(1,2-epoxy-1,2-dihydrophenyl)acetyl-CoA isomerase
MQIQNNAIRLETDGAGLATIVLSQAERGNPIDGDFCRALLQVMNQLWTMKPLRAVLIRAEGKNFSVGGDIKGFAANLEQLPEKIYQWTSDLHMGLARAWHLPVPVIAQVHGCAMGGAVAVLAGADIVVAGESSRFGSAFAQIGFSCDSGTSVTLSMRMGAARAKRFTMLGEVLSSAQAHACGLVDILVADADLDSRALALAQQLANGPTVALGEIKRLFLRAGAAQMEAQLEDEAQTLARVARSADAQGAVAAFVAKRKYVFTGS